MFTRRIPVLACTACALAAHAQPNCPPDQVTGVSATDSTLCNEIRITWNSVEGATSYQVYRGTSNQFSSAGLLGPSLTTTYHDFDANPGTFYYYWVRAFRAPCLPGSNYGGYGGPNQGRRATQPPPPTNLNASEGQCLAVNLSWDAAPVPATYDVYRNTTNSYGSSTQLNSVAVAAPAYVDTTATQGVQYYYWVTATTICGTSNASESDPGFRGAPVPGNLDAVGACEPKGIRISWSGPTGLPVQIYRGTTNQFPTGTNPVGATVASFWYDVTVSAQQRYYYWARSQTPCGESEFAGPVSAIEGSPLEAPHNVRAENGSLCGTAKVLWDSPTGTPAPLSYSILRASSDLYSLAQQVGTTSQTSYVDNTVNPGTHYYYWVFSTNDCGPGLPNIQSAPWIYEALAIAQQPASVVATAGQSAQFAVETAGGGTPTYQWRRNGQNLVDGGAISGSTTANLTINPVSPAAAGQYDVLLDDGCTELTSSQAELTVVSPCYADCNGDTLLNLADFGCFQTKFALGDMYADCNSDAVLNLADFGCYQTKFALGCP